MRILEFGSDKTYFDQDIKTVWNKIKDNIHKRFEDGYATCTLATYSVSLLRDEYDIVAVSGDYNDSGHWWNIATLDDKKFIVDLGNNTSKQALDTGVIEPVIIPYPDSKYKDESIVDAERFVNEVYPKIKNF